MKKPASDVLVTLIQNRDLTAVRQLLAESDPPLTRQELGAGLRYASIRGKQQSSTIRLLLEHGANPNEQGILGPILHGFAMNGELEAVKTLLEFGADPNRRHGKETALSAALSENQTETVRFLEHIGAQIDPSLQLLYAAKHGNLDRARAAIGAGANIEVKGGTPTETPLIAAAGRGQIEMVKLLLKHGANPSRKCEYDSPVFSAARASHPDIVEILVKAGASPDTAFYGETPLMAAASNGDLATARKLLELGADPTIEDRQRHMTAVDYAREGKHKELYAFLSGLGVTAARDGWNLLARRLRREYGGRLVEHVRGFMLNTKLSGRSCQFHIDDRGAAVAVFGVKYRAAELRVRPMPSITIGAKDSTFFGDPSRLQQAPDPSKAAGFNVYSSLPPNDKFHQQLAAFCERLQPRLAELLTTDGVSFHFSHDCVGLAWRDLRGDSTLARLACFVSLLDEIARAPEPERRLFDREWLIKPAPVVARGHARPVARHIFGGESASTVGCRSCERAANPIIRIELGDPQLPACALGRDALSIHWCLGCGEWSPTYFPVAGRTTQSRALSESQEENLPEREMTLVAVPPGKKAGRKSKLGGSPTWIQSDDWPDCERCSEAMTFALQMSSDSRISYGDVGMLYVFVCPNCRIIATLVQSH